MNRQQMMFLVAGCKTMLTLGLLASLLLVAGQEVGPTESKQTESPRSDDRTDRVK